MCRPHICHKYHKLYLWRKICHVEKFQISVKNLNNLWSFIEIYAVCVLNLCGENLCGEKMTNMRSGPVFLIYLRASPRRSCQIMREMAFEAISDLHKLPPAQEPRSWGPKFWSKISTPSSKACHHE